jgi:hypothetical protein
MRKRTRTVLALAVVSSLVLLSGCYFSIFDTARTVGAGNVAFTLGAAVMDLALDGTPSWLLAPQGRLTVGLAPNVDFGIRSGMMLNLETGDVGFLGAVGDFKFALFQEPDSFALALGFGGGYSTGLVGWGLEASVYFESTVRYLPIYVVYRPLLPLTGEELGLIHQLAGGLYLALSPNARLLVELDSWNGLLSGGVALEILF